MDFQSFNLHPQIAKGIKSLKYETPTQIQAEAIPIILGNRDIVGIAHTGTGKTAAFLLPILQRLMEGPRGLVRALIIAPTRELAEQTHGFIRQMARFTKLKSVTLYGGIRRKSQINKLHGGAEIAVACPGRLLDFMESGEIDLSNVEVLVLDEADEMFDMGFLPDIRKIIGGIPAERQTLLFSATMPDEIRELAGAILRDPVNIQVGETAPVPTVSHAIYVVGQHLKTPLLMKLIESEEMNSVLVFARTKSRTDRLARQMKKAGFSVASIQGDMSQGRRQEALNGFRKGKYRILVATDIAARGIDVTDISHVVNYDMPDTVDAYTHRIGRTGRADRTGTAYSFVTMQDRGFVWSIENAIGEKLERKTLDGFDYSVPAPPGSEEERRDSRPAPSKKPSRRDISSLPALLGFPGAQENSGSVSRQKHLLDSLRRRARGSR
jgi:superfamily II DNA/RNA helicase